MNALHSAAAERESREELVEDAIVWAVQHDLVRDGVQVGGNAVRASRLERLW